MKVDPKTHQNLHFSFFLTSNFVYGQYKIFDGNSLKFRYQPVRSQKINLWKKSNFWYVNIYYSHIGFVKLSLACFGAKYPPADDFFA